MVSTTAAPSAIVSEHLNVDNYEYWSRCVKNYLLAEGLWEVVEASGDPPPENNAWRRQNAKALHVILISCGSGIFPDISDAKSARVAWDLLARKFRSVYYSNQSDPTLVDGDRRVQPKESSEIEEEATTDPTPVDGDRRVQPKESSKIEEEATTGHENGGLNDGALLFKFGTKSDLNEVMEFIDKNPKAARMRHPDGWTALHMAVSKEDAKAVEKLVQLMEKEDFQIKDKLHGLTAFHYAINMPSAKLNIVECLIGKDETLAYTYFDYFHYKKVLPVLIAVSNSNWKLAEYLYLLTPEEYFMPENGPNGADIITSCILRKKIYIAWDLIQRDPRLAVTNDFSGYCPLYMLASMRSAFSSGTPLTFWQRWIYDRIKIKYDLTSFSAPDCDEENQKEQIESVERCHQCKIWIHCAAVRKFVEEFFMAVLKLLGIFDRVYKKKLFHEQIRHLLQCMDLSGIEQTSNSVVQTAIFRAIQRGLVEFVDVLGRKNPYTGAIKFCDERGRNALAYAVECRQEKIYNLIREIYADKDGRDYTVDKMKNSLLHIVGSSSPSVQFDHIRDAALQMQRELQWFKEMESFVSPNLHEVVNSKDQMTGRELFTKNHKELVKEGEESMKETATSCSIAGALIVTMMFASAFTVVGGNDGNTGLPVLLDNKLFMVFIVSDALSLFSSTTSVMIFLGILTSRFQENDFRRSLPTKMMVGVLFLLFSIATMMVAFSTTLIIMLHDKYSWIVAPITVLACLPITSFVWMQYPLLAEICVSTYGPGRLGKRASSEDIL